ncbi:hypothetical protein M0H57_001095 [Proteus mirabilis]|nr:hypothetical protein [Proteus mirabilis]
MKLKNILDAMRCGANWLFGMYQRPYLKEWDDYLNYLIDECSIADERDCVITFNDGGEKVEVWKKINTTHMAINTMFLVVRRMSSGRHSER